VVVSRIGASMSMSYEYPGYQGWYSQWLVSADD